MMETASSFSMSTYITKIFGAPGTGKTTTLIKFLQDEVMSLGSVEKIAFCSYTITGSDEGANRARETLAKSKEKDFEYFRTLHGLCQRSVGMLKRYRLMTIPLWRLFNKMSDFNLGKDFGDENAVLTEDAALLQLIELRRAHHEKWEQKILKLCPERIARMEALEQEVKKFKTGTYRGSKIYGGKPLCDFADMQEEYLRSGHPLPVSVAFIDEAQDLTRTQWMVAKKAFANCSRIYIAGDDDQAIMGWAGSDFEEFLHGGYSEKIVLPINYRSPQRHFAMSQRVIQTVKEREAKDVRVRDGAPEGEVLLTGLNKTRTLQKFFRGKENELRNESWLILSRDNFAQREIMQRLREGGLIFSIQGGTSEKKNAGRCKLSYDPDVLLALVELTDYKAGVISRLELDFYHKCQTLTPQQDSRDYTFTADDPKADGVGTLNTRFYEPEYYKGLLDYYLKNRARLELTDGYIPEPQSILLSTIGRAKGMEADNVLFYTGVTKRVWASIDEPDEARYLYVAITRAKKRLFFCYKGDIYKSLDDTECHPNGYETFFSELWFDELYGTY